MSKTISKDLHNCSTELNIDVHWEEETQTDSVLLLHNNSILNYLGNALHKHSTFSQNFRQKMQETDTN